MTQNINGDKIVNLAEVEVYGHTVRLEVMPMDVFLSHPECDTQRDTEGRAAKAFRSHLKLESPLHGLVFIAELPEGDRYIIDACTRRYLWQEGKKKALENIVAYTVLCDSLEEARQFYFQLDSSSAVDRSADVAFGLLRASHIAAKSELVRRSGYLTGLHKAFPIMQPKVAVPKASELLDLLDQLNLSRRALPAGTMAAFFLSALRHGANVMPFWQDVAQNRGVSTDDGRSGPAALIYRINMARNQNKLTGDKNVTRLMEQALCVVETYMANPEEMFSDEWNEHIRREAYVKSTVTDHPELADWFAKPKREAARKVKVAQVRKPRAPRAARSGKTIRGPAEESA